MNLRKTIDTERETMEEMRKTFDLDAFGDVMDGFIRKSAVGLLVCKEENEEGWTVQGVGCGSVVDFYVMINALQPIFLQMLRDMKGQIDPALLATSLCNVLRDSLVKAAEEEAAEDPDGAAEEEAAEDPDGAAEEEAAEDPDGAAEEEAAEDPDGATEEEGR